MKITTLPALNTWIAFKILIEWMGHDFIEPPKLTQDQLKWGTKHIPEYACLPMKQYAGFYERALASGAEAAFVFGIRNVRACRYLDIGEGFEDEIRKQGKDFKVYYWGGYGVKSAIGAVQRLVECGRKKRKIRPHNFLYGVWLFMKTLDLVDGIEQEANIMRPRERKKGIVDAWLKWGFEEAKKARNLKEIKNSTLKIKNAKLKLDIDWKKQLPRVILIGDVFKIHEDFFHFDTFRKMSKFGIEVVRTFNFADMFRGSNKFPLPKEKRAKYRETLAKKYLHTPPASYLDWSIGDLVHECENNQVDGIIHFQTFNCMPDIVMRSVTDRIAKEYKKPIMHFMRDEHSSDAGYMTRLEAFADLITANKR